MTTKLTTKLMTEEQLNRCYELSRNLTQFLYEAVMVQGYRVEDVEMSCAVIRGVTDATIAEKDLIAQIREFGHKQGMRPKGGTRAEN